VMSKRVNVSHSKVFDFVLETKFEMVHNTNQNPIRH
jgi:hypothetical protein